MADTIQLIMILHNHQPVGNFDWVFRNAAEDSYLPFLDMLERHPHIRTGLHTTGPLLEWFEDNRPDYLDRLAGLVEKGRVEILGGAFYEPILSKLPDRDKVGQIGMMSDWIARRFGSKPAGFWVAERIWEPCFAGIYGRCGLEYTTLDNTHFQYAGVPEDRIWGSWATEDQGTGVRVLPIDYNLRYLIPFHDPQETIDYIGGLKDRGVTAVTYADDGEKFGVWPGTKKWVYDDGWLERFFTRLEDNADWIEIVLPGDYVRDNPPVGHVYLPTASYKEMSEWALPADAQVRLAHAEKSLEGDERFIELRSFVRGGFWRNFLTKYPESHNMYRRMLMVSGEVEAAGGKPGCDAAVRELYRAQCNCGYWHGVFGGLYLNFLRRAIYEHLIRAEALVSDASANTTITDFDGDGRDEAILRDGSQVLFIKPDLGGAAFEYDCIPKAFNLFDTFTRREEAYHHEIPGDAENGGEGHESIHDGIRSKEADIRRYLHYDPYRRLSFIDHFLAEDEPFEAFTAGAYDERGDWVDSPYELIRSKDDPVPGILLARDGTVRCDADNVPVRVNKRYTLAGEGGGFAVDYRLEFERPVTGVLFGVEINLGLQSGRDDACVISIPGRTLDDPHFASTGIETDVGSVELSIGWMPLRVSLSFSRSAELRRFPVETVSLSEGGVERTYQNTCLVPVWKLEKTPDNRYDFTITTEVMS